VISALAKSYEPVRLPHSKIVAKLDAGARASSLANRFHERTDRLCTGCHHHSPVGAPPPQCRSCHGETAAATVDKPALLVAYHRQCIGCHQAMDIKKQGCTDCHAAKEVQP
jgi:DnaJ-class molecular chaperone